MKRLLIIILVLVSSCRYIPENVELFPEDVSINDGRIQPFIRAAASFDRVSHGFTPLPKTADVRVERSRGAKYDVMLHIYSKTSRNIAFRKINGGYRWIGEQERFQGPKQHTGADGTFYEDIVLTYEIESVSGVPLNQLSVIYLGDDPRLAHHWNLTLNDAKPVLKEWGY